MASLIGHRSGAARIIGALGIACTGFAAYHANTLAAWITATPDGPSHYEMSARVVAIEKICRLQFAAQTGRLSRPMNCNLARKVVRQRSAFRDAAVIELDEVAYEYQSQRGDEHTGWLETEHHPETPAYEINDTLPIRVEVGNPTVVEPL